MSTLRAMWAVFAVTRIPPNAAALQRADMEVAFYSGAVAAMELTNKALADGASGSTASAAVQAELDAWIEEHEPPTAH